MWEESKIMKEIFGLNYEVVVSPNPDRMIVDLRPFVIEEVGPDRAEQEGADNIEFTMATIIGGVKPEVTLSTKGSQRETFSADTIVVSRRPCGLTRILLTEQNCQPCIHLRTDITDVEVLENDWFDRVYN